MPYLQENNEMNMEWFQWTILKQKISGGSYASREENIIDALNTIIWIVKTPEGSLFIFTYIDICVRYIGVWVIMMEESNYDSHILDVDREKLDLLALGKPVELVN